MHAKTVKNNIHLQAMGAINNLFISGDISGDLSLDIRRFVGRYFKYRSFFAANDMTKRFSHIVSATSKKGDIGRYIDRLGQYLKHASL